jgi:hypothetical protein
MRKIYVASSWRNTIQPRIVKLLRTAGHEVYDFRNPGLGSCGFAWSQIDEGWLNWGVNGYLKYIQHPIAKHGFADDKGGLDWCDTCVLLLPCGRSAHLEAGYAIGQGKDTIFYLVEDKFEPELMYLLGNGFVATDEELLTILK